MSISPEYRTYTTLWKWSITFHTYMHTWCNKFTCCIKHGVKHKVHQVQRKQIDSHKVCSKCPPGRQMCVRVCTAYFSDFKLVLPQQNSQLRDVCGLPLPIDDQASQFLAKFSTILFISLRFYSISYQVIPESVVEHHSLLIPINFNQKLL